MAVITVSGLSPGIGVPVIVTGTATNIQINLTQPTPNTAGLTGTGGWSSVLTGWQAQNGSTINLRATTSSQYATEVYVTLQIGTSESTWYLTTLNTPGDIPDPLPVFNDVTTDQLNTNIYSNVQQILGLTASSVTMTVSGTGGNGSSGNTARVAKSSSANTDINGILTGSSFSSNTISVSNGDYIQLRQTSSSNTNITIATGAVIGGSDTITWNVITGNPGDSTPDTFAFFNITNATPNTEYASGINSGGTALTISGITTTAQVQLVSYTSASAPLVKVNNGSIGTFPTTVSNGDTLRVYMTSPSSLSSTVSTEIQVGTFQPVPWTISTSASADTTPDDFNFVNATNKPPSTVTDSNTVAITGMTGSATVTTTGGALISINGGAFSSSPQTISNNQTLTVRLTSSASLGGSVSTTVVVGTLSKTWSVSTYASAPTTASQYGKWYSRKNKKEDGLAIGTVIPITRDQFGNWGTLDGSLSSRFPGFIECSGQTLNVSDYLALFLVIGNDYGGTGSYDPSTKVASGNFKLPNYKNRKLVGVGNVDGNNASSASLTTYKGPDPNSVSTGSINVAGSSGGNWYIDTIDTAGVKPPEQVYDDATTDVDGPYYKLGTIQTTGYSTIVSETDYTISGLVSATVGPLSETTTRIPGHTHTMVTGQRGTESVSYIQWGVRAFAGNPGSSYWKSSSYNSSMIAPKPPPDGIGGPGFTQSDATKGWWWRSQKNGAVQLDNAPGNNLAMIDTTASSASVASYDPGAFGGQLNHSHYISETSYGSDLNTYGWGNISGGGTPQGFTGNTSLSVVFNQAQVQLGANSATFTLSSSKQLIPTVNLSPQKRIPLMNKYFRVKYLIKAF